MITVLKELCFQQHKYTFFYKILKAPIWQVKNNNRINVYLLLGLEMLSKKRSIYMEHSNIRCNVKDCQHYDRDNSCTLSSITIGGSGSSQSEPDCKSFEHKSGSMQSSSRSSSLGSSSSSSSGSSYSSGSSSSFGSGSSSYGSGSSSSGSQGSGSKSYGSGSGSSGSSSSGSSSSGSSSSGTGSSSSSYSPSSKSEKKPKSY